MKFEIVGKNVAITDAMRERIEKKLSFLDKYILINPEDVARVVCKVYPNSQKVEITIPTKVGILRSEVEDKDFYNALDLSIDKLEDQLRRQKTRLSRKHKDKLALAFIESDEDKLKEGDIPVKTKVIEVAKMDVEEAIMRMEMLGHDFFVYDDVDDDKISIVYRRKDNNYGLIEVEKQ